ncbi:MAG TPA: DUF929 family protein, partial [Acidimicrobiales bacterium]|nr:DUF929 family protein [Acidimicrobiales bacterium]
RPGSANRSSAGGGVPRALWAVVALVVVAAVVIVIVATTGGSSKGPNVSGSMPPSVVKAVTTGVSNSTLQSASAGAGSSVSLPVSLGTQTPLVSNGKPEVLYIGAEFCPYCAAERWAMVQALSRFGTFTGLGQMTSSSTDIYPSTPTFTFYKSSYSSPYLTFVPVETETNTSQPLQSPTSAENALVNKFDTSPYVQGSSGSIPFIDFGNKYVQSGASYSPQLLQNQTFAQIAEQMTLPGTTVGSAIDTAANYLTAAICSITGNQPSSVCNLSFIQEASVKLQSSKPASSSNGTPGAAG